MAYSSAAEVTAFTRRFLDGQTAFNSTTAPTSSELTTFISRASAVLDVSLAGRGLSTPITNSTAKLACDDWVTARAAEYVELTQAGIGSSDGEGNRAGAFANLSKSAKTFADEMAAGLILVGAAKAQTLYGIEFTGLTVRADRADPDDTALEQPKFTRGQWDFPGVVGNGDE